MSLSEFSRVPVIDVAALVNQTALNPTAERAQAAEQIGTACRECGFFYIAGHGVDESLCRQLEALSRRFFDQSEPEKMQIAMARGGPAWRGYFPLGGELTSGKPDRKEGLYFGAELAADHPAVLAGTPPSRSEPVPRDSRFSRNGAALHRFVDRARPRLGVWDLTESWLASR